MRKLLSHKALSRLAFLEPWDDSLTYWLRNRPHLRHILRRVTVANTRAIFVKNDI